MIDKYVIRLENKLAAKTLLFNKIITHVQQNQAKKLHKFIHNCTTTVDSIKESYINWLYYMLANMRKVDGDCMVQRFRSIPLPWYYLGVTSLSYKILWRPLIQSRPFTFIKIVNLQSCCWAANSLSGSNFGLKICSKGSFRPV